MELVTIEINELRDLYRRMKRDFPPSERAPYFAVRRAFKSGLFDGFFLSDGSTRLGYAICTPLSQLGYALVNYFAIEPESRGSGCGTRFLELISSRYPSLFIILEVENPEFAKDGAERETMQRRIRFYERAGYHIISTVRYRLFGVEMLLMTDAKGEIFDIEQLMKSFYRPALRFVGLMKNVEVILTKRID